MFCAGAFISLSNLYESAALQADPDNPLPIYVPVLMSCTIPMIFSSFSIFTRYVFRVKKINATDYTFSYIMLMRGCCSLTTVFYFYMNGINLKDYSVGTLGSVLEMLGCYFVNCAIATGQPVGPIFALCDSQWVLSTSVVALYSQTLPHWMQ